MKTYNTRAGKWLALIRLQSTPVTVVSLSLGYFSVVGTLDRRILPLILVGALGHWGFYALNDVRDVDVDMAQAKEMKPLVAGDIYIHKAEFVAYFLIFSSIFAAVFTFPSYALGTYMIACLAGWYYDVNSKTHIYSSLYLGGWGVMIIWTGALYAQGWSGYTALMSLLFGTHMIWMTVIGDLKDIRSDEPNLPQKFNCHIGSSFEPLKNPDRAKRMIKTPAFQMYVMAPLIASQVFLSLSIPAYRVALGGLAIQGLLYITVLMVLSFFFINTGWTIGSDVPYTEESVIKDIVVNEVSAVLMIIWASSVFIPLDVIMILLLGSVVWGLSILRIQFGSFTRFP